MSKQLHFNGRFSGKSWLASSHCEKMAQIFNCDILPLPFLECSTYR